MDFRLSRNLVFVPTADGFQTINYLTGNPVLIPSAILAALDDFTEWTEESEAEERLDRETISALRDCGALIERNSEMDRKEEQLNDSWSWGPLAAAYHFTLRDRPFVSVDEAEERQVQKNAVKPSPNLLRRNSADATQLPYPDPDSELMRVMARRRSQRDADGTAIGLSSLAQMLIAGLGVNGETSNRAGRLPLTMTPSGGARNPFEAYVAVKRVEALQCGIYHYSATQHSLERTVDQFDWDLSECFGGQSWVDDAAAVILLVADLERTMWKYDDPAGYRVVLIEAGHIAQNILLAATAAGWAGCPTAAIDPAKLTGLCGLPDSPASTPFYGVALTSVLRS